jgi:hypothetical protein
MSNLKVSFEDSATVRAIATTRTNLAVQHLLAASKFSREVKRVEDGNAGSEFGGFWEDILHYSIACTFGCAASLEAYANELFHDRATVFSGYSNPLLDRLWETFETKPILEKFQFALLLKNAPEMDRGAKVFQHATALVHLRNALTHFKPEWANEAVEHRKLSNRLAGLFTPGPFLKDELIFPRRWATHGCTAWAVRTVRAFAESFEQHGQLPSKYSAWTERLAP